MQIIAPDIVPALPELYVLAVACTVLLIDLFLTEAQRHFLLTFILATLGGAALLTLADRKSVV